MAGPTANAVFVATALAPLLATVALGVVWRWAKAPFDSRFTSALIARVTAPCLVVDALWSLEVDLLAAATVAAAALATFAVTAGLAGLALRLTGVRSRAVAAGLLFPNVGNVGLSLSATAFGEVGLGFASVVFVVYALAQSLVLPPLMAGARPWRALFFSPLPYAGVLGVLGLHLGVSPPEPVARALAMIGAVTIPLMLFSLGFAVAGMSPKTSWRLAGWAMARLALGLTVGVLAAAVFALPDVARAVIILQSAGPAAVFTYVIALKEGREPDTAAAMVLWSTLGFLALAPALLVWL